MTIYIPKLNISIAKIYLEKMGLHSEMRGYFRNTFPDSVLQHLPSCDVQIVDFMWLLYRFYTPHSACHPREFIAFGSSNAERFFTAGGSVFVFCFDTPGLVPLAKAEEHLKRAKRKGSELVSSPLTADALPHPWMTALLDRKVRGALIELLSVGLCEWFENSPGCRSKTLIIHGPLGTLSRGLDTLELDLRGVGEADLTVSSFATYYSNRTTVVRVLDSDELPILLLSMQRKKRVKPLYVWLTNGKKEYEQQEVIGEFDLAVENKTIFHLTRMKETCPCAVDLFVFFVIIQRSDFVRKIIVGANVSKVMSSLIESGKGREKSLLRLGEDEAFLNADEMEKLFKKVAESTKRAKLLEDSACKMLRAWWNWLYWGFGGDGPLPTTLSPTRYAWDGEGRRETVETCKQMFTFKIDGSL